MPQPPSELPLPALALPRTGTVVAGRYQVERLLGSGGMSAVYLARQIPLGRPCALKVLLPERAAHPDATARFKREAALASRIAHPNLCHVYDFGRTPEGLSWLAMEYLEGESLAAALGGGPLGVDRAIAISLGCAAGLSAAHAGGIIHRDLKPANVMLVHRNGVEAPVVLDFGIAWAPDSQGLTRDGMMVGTPEVMSPEQIAGDPVDERSDQYQLALLTCRMLTGKLPFAGATTQETMLLRLTDQPTTLDQLLPGLAIGPALQAVISRALSRQPSDRFPDIAHLGEALRASAFSVGEPATEILPRLAHHPARPTRGAAVHSSHWARRPLRWGLAAATLLAVAWLAMTQPWQPAPPGGEPPTTNTVPPASVSLPPAPPPAPPAATPSNPGVVVPPLPAEGAVFSTDSAVRRGARQKAELVYRSVAAADSVRALAAYFVAEVFIREGLYSTAREWLELCLALGERKLCRDLLLALP